MLPAVLQLFWDICFLWDGGVGGMKQYFCPGKHYYKDILVVSFKSLFMADFLPF